MKDSQKGFIVPVLVVIIALLVVGGGVYVYKNKKAEQSATSTQIQQDNQFNVARTGTTNETVSSCESIKKHYNGYGADDTDELKFACYTQVAIKNKDISLCDRISDSSSYKGSCRYYVSVAKQDLSLCDQLPNERSNFSKYACYSAIGSSKQDESICNLIPANSPGGDRSACITAVARVKGDCEVLSGSGRDYCYLYQSNAVRVSAKDNRCDVLLGVKSRALCEKYVKNEITVSEDCNRIVDTNLRQQCMSYDVSSVRVNYTN